MIAFKITNSKESFMDNISPIKIISFKHNNLDIADRSRERFSHKLSKSNLINTNFNKTDNNIVKIDINNLYVDESINSLQKLQMIRNEANKNEGQFNEDKQSKNNRLELRLHINSNNKRSNNIKIELNTSNNYRHNDSY